MWDLIQLGLLVMFCIFLFANTGNLLMFFSGIFEKLFNLFDISNWRK